MTWGQFVFLSISVMVCFYFQVSDITQKIECGSFQCLIESHQIIIGKVVPSMSNTCNFEQGLIQFFNTHNAGIIDGPHVVAIWKEDNYYCMFDAKGRDRFGRKWKKEAKNDEENSMSCVTRYQLLGDLVDIYIGNVPIKQRHDYYKITCVELNDFLGKNWYEWKIISHGQWCLRGKEIVNLQSMFCLSIMALLYADNTTVKEWTSNIIDEIASAATLYSADFEPTNFESDMKEIKKEIVFRDVASVAKINQKMFRYVVNEVNKDIEDDLIQGMTSE